MEERGTRSYRFPINRSVEQILPRVLFRTLFRRVYSVPRSSIKCRVSRARPSLPRVPSRSISSRAYETELSPLCPDLLPSPFLRISNISKLIGGEKMGEWTSNLERPQREWRDGEISWLSFGTIGIPAGISFRISRKYRSFLFLWFVYMCVCVEIFSSKNATIFKHDSTFLRDSWSYAFVVILLLEVRDWNLEF